MRGSEGRAAVQQVVAGGTADDVVAAYLALARSLLEERHPAEAAAELEQCVNLLAFWNAGGPPRTIWCVMLTLAGLYAILGDPARARRIARAARLHAIRARCTVGEERAKALLARLQIVSDVTS